MLDYADVLIDIRGQGQQTAPGRCAFECVIQVQGSGQRRGTIEVDDNTLDIATPDSYGEALGRALATPALTAALVEAEVLAPSHVRLRLQIDERAEALQALRWELVRLPACANPDVAASTATPFSRYVPLAEQDRTPPGDPVFTVLVALANPLGLDDTMTVPVEREIASLLDEFVSQKLTEMSRLRVLVMPGRTPISDALRQRITAARWTLVEGPSSLRQIQTVLQRGTGSAQQGCHALHLVCHGRTLRNRSELTLEDEGGGQAQVADALLAAWYHPRLQLLLLQSCRTAAPTPDRPPFSHIAGQMLQLGVPAVVAMQDLVGMDDARYFAAAFYRSLLRDGLVDVAANRGRLAMKDRLGAANWSIPALYMRLKGGLLWSPDAVRDYVVRKRRLLEGAREQTELPLKVIEHAPGLAYDPAAGAVGRWFNMSARTSELLRTRGVAVILTGSQGSGKTAEAKRLFCELADEFLGGTTDRAVAPVFGRLSDLSPWAARSNDDRTDLFADFRQIANGYGVPDRLKDAQLAFIIVRDYTLGRAARFDALHALRRVLDAFPGSSCLLTYGESELRELDSLSKTIVVLAVQPMNWLEIRGYLRVHDAALLDRLSSNRLDDLATSPWLLAQMREQARVQGLQSALQNRAEVLGASVARLLTKFDTTRMPLAAAERVLETIAWRIQEKRPTEPSAAAGARLGQMDVDQVIAEVRGSGEYSIADMRRALVDCELVAQSGEGDVRFTSRSIRAYLAARYLAKSSHPDDLVDNLAATFGRLGRLRYWSETLIVLAALPQFRTHRLALLNSILTGSSMLEGEQVYLAARLYVEMAASKSADDILFDSKAATTPGTESHGVADTVRQIVDSLVWRARDVEGRPYDDRRKAVEHLAEMKHPDAVPHLVQIAVDRVRTGGPGSAKAAHHEYASLRFLAMDGLWQQVDATLDAVAKREDAAGLNEVIQSWQRMYTDPTQSGDLLRILCADTSEHAPIAAFALLQFGPSVVEALLLPLYRSTLRNWELLWCITEGLSWMDGDWLAAKVIDPAIAQHHLTPPDEVREDLRAMLCYLIRELGDAPPDSPRRRYLEQTLLEGEQTSRIWALRALAKLQDFPAGLAGVPSLSPRILAQDILTSAAATLAPLGIEPDWKWKQGALEALRDAGDSESFDLIRRVRLTLGDSALFRLSFQVAEEIYWRSTGGMIQATT